MRPSNIKTVPKASAKATMGAKAAVKNKPMTSNTAAKKALGAMRRGR